MENSTKAIIIAASIVITMAIVSMAVFVFNLTRPIIDDVEKDLTGTAQGIKEGKYKKYEGDGKSGSEVIALIETLDNFSGELIGVSVKTNSGSTKWYVYDASNPENLSKVDRYYRNDNDPNNINPAGKFKGTIVRNGIKEIVAVTFEQQ